MRAERGQTWELFGSPASPTASRLYLVLGSGAYGAGFAILNLETGDVNQTVDTRLQDRPDVWRRVS